MIKTSLIFICFDSIQIFREINSMSFQVSLGHQFLTKVKQFLHFFIRSFEFFRHGFLSMKDSLKCIVTLECDLRAQIQIIFFIGFLMAKCLVVWLLVWLNSWLLSLYYTKFFSINQWHLINNHSFLSAKYVIKGNWMKIHKLCTFSVYGYPPTCALRSLWSTMKNARKYIFLSPG